MRIDDAADECEQSSASPRAAGGKPAQDVILFLCGHNAGRSIMAEAWFNAHNRNPAVRAVSAGTEPATEINPEVRRVLEEHHIAIGGLGPKMLTADILNGVSGVYTMGCNVSTDDVPPAKLRGDLGIDDPHRQDRAAVRHIFDTLKQRLEPLLEHFNS